MVNSTLFLLLINVFFGNVKNIPNQHNQDRAMEFLQGFHNRFLDVRSQILRMDLFPSIYHIYNLVHKEEKQQENNFQHLPTIESTALQTSKGPYHTPGKRQCTYYNNCK